MSTSSLVVLVGPTAVGKSDTAIRLAQRLNAEIVSADSRLFYRGMDIGTAKPSLEDRARAPHHLIDIADADQTLSLAVFQELARKSIYEISARGRLPMLVGGTGQYVRAVTDGWHPAPIAPNPALRSRLAALNQQKGPAWLHEKLGILDPDSAQSIDPRNLRRTVRALEVILTSGHRFSEQRGSSAPSYPIIGIGLRRPRVDLYARIDARIERMFEQGLVEEMRGLLERGYAPELPAFSAIGYREAIKVLSGELTVEDAKAQVKRLTRAFVRRQGNWFKETDPRWKWFEAGEEDVEARIETYVRAVLQKGQSLASV